MAFNHQLITSIAASYTQSLAHPEQVCRIAEQLFDVCASLHGLGDSERDLLKTAALLHDIGWVGGRCKHHKRSRDLILSNPPEGLLPRELAIVANVARYHRKALPSANHKSFHSLSRRDQEIVRRLAALLRIADGLDVTHRSIVRRITLRLGPGVAVFSVTAAGDASIELETALKKSDLFREVFGLAVQFDMQVRQY